MDFGRQSSTEELLLMQVEWLDGHCRLDSAIERVPLPVIVHDGVEIIALNSGAAAWLGHASPRALARHSLSVLSNEEDQVALLAALGATSSGPPEGIHLQRFRGREGRVVLGEVLSRKVRTDGTVRTVVIVQPIDGTHRSPDHLRLLEAAVDHLRDIVFITEADAIDALGRRVVFVNRAFSEITGFSPRDVLGKTPNVTVGDATDRAALRRIEEGLKKRLPVHEELQKYGKDGTRYWVELDIIPVFDDSGRHTHWVSVQRDVTERKRLHSELAGAERLVSRAAGEENDPLAHAMQNLELVAQRLLDPDARDLPDSTSVDEQLVVVRQGLERARTDAQRARGILRQLAVLAEGPRRKRDEVELGGLVERALEEVASDTRILAEIVRRMEPAPTVLAFSNQLSQVIYGLVLDAVHSLDPSYADANTLFLRVVSRGDHVVCEVEATGPGAAAPARSMKNAPGAGLGLLVGRSIVRSMGGQLSHHPSPGMGTLHRLRLPLPARRRGRSESSERVAPKVRGARVLIVEPDARHAQALRRLLAAVDHVVVEATTRDALKRVESGEEFNVVFCDLSTLGGDARQLYVALGDRRPELISRVVFTRSESLPRNMDTFLGVAGRPHIDKPFQSEQVRSALSTILAASDT